jgi:carnitine-CoA ligase
MRNLSELIVNQMERRPELLMGVPETKLRLEVAARRAAGVARSLGAAGLEPGARVAVIAHTSTEYLVFWLACQMAGVAPALINPSYPVELLHAMLGDLDPAAVATWNGEEAYGSPALSIGFGGIAEGTMTVAGRRHTTPPADPGTTLGLERAELDCAGYMHTSGTTGRPKFCSQSHRYFLRLARYVADLLGIGPDDRVIAPLPMFHINPMGYGFVGSLYAGANITALERFRPEEFWPIVVGERSTAMLLHAPPVQVLKQRTTPSDAAGHSCRVVFYADKDFIEQFRVPLAVSAYGSTEAGGLIHHRLWRKGDRVPEDVPEGMGCLTGSARSDVDWMISDDGEILVRGAEPGVLFSGYWRAGRLDQAIGANGWYATGDVGRRAYRELVFMHRRSESIRVRGEYVPIEYVEQYLAREVHGVDIALWKRELASVADEMPVLYVASDVLPIEDLRRAITGLPRFMRPVEILRVTEIPRDEGAGKVRRRLLKDSEILEAIKL